MHSQHAAARTCALPLATVLLTLAVASCAAAPTTVTPRPTATPTLLAPTPLPPTAQAPTPTLAPTVPPTAITTPTAATTFGVTTVPSPHELPPPHSFDGAAAYEHVLAQDEPRPVGSAASLRLGDYIVEHLQAAGWQVEVQEFTYQGISARNIIGKAGSGPIAIVGAHYDTRRVADADPDPAKRTTPVPGANDGASGVAVLLELAEALDPADLQYQVWLTFFDAEDNGDLDGWDWSAGATYMAENLTETPYFVVVVDMIGDADQQIYRERNSNAVLLDYIWSIAASLGYEQYFIPEYKWGMTDDHTPFLERGIPAADLIDFDYPYWHTTEDTADKVSAESLEHVGRVLQVLLEGE